MKSEKRQLQTSAMFFTVKILTLLFIAIPIFARMLEGMESDETMSTSLVIVFLLLASVVFMWIFIDKKRQNNSVITVVEIAAFFVMCVIAICFSGGVDSRYKFIFIFVIVLYTIEYDMNHGMAIAAVSSAYLLASDLMFGEVNPEGVNTTFETDLVIAAMFIIVAWTLGYYVQISNKRIDTLRDNANRDGLTNAYNHRFFYETVHDYALEAAQTGRRLSLMMFDIDNFKEYNDIYGHQKGDEILIRVSQLVHENLGEKELLCRYGGDEFAIIFPDQDIEYARDFAEKIKEANAKKNMDVVNEGTLTFSAGVAEFRGAADTYTALVKRADAALYRAKFLKRNRVEAYSSIFDEFVGQNVDMKTEESLSSIKALIAVINSRDSYTFEHVERVVLICSEFGRYIRLDDAQQKRLVYAAYLHDLGKINISKETLISDKALSDSEWEILKKHPVDSVRIISEMGGFEDLEQIVLQHHERYDGKGYPLGLRGSKIDYLARVLTLADSYDAMTSKRPYQEPKTRREAIEEIRECLGKQFDPSIGKRFVEFLESGDIV